MAGWWNCDALDQMFARVLVSDLPIQVCTLRDNLFFLKAKLTNLQAGNWALKAGRQQSALADCAVEKRFTLSLRCAAPIPT